MFYCTLLPIRWKPNFTRTPWLNPISKLSCLFNHDLSCCKVDKGCGRFGFSWPETFQLGAPSQTSLEISGVPGQPMCSSSYNEILPKWQPTGHSFPSFPVTHMEINCLRLGVTEKGTYWRIGRGNSVRIWRDPWIPRGWMMRASSREEETMSFEMGLPAHKR
jgi:hypothetical protein